MNSIQKLRLSGLNRRISDKIPPYLRYDYLEAVYNLASLIHYRRIDLFLSVVIETTSLCNRRCSICPNGDDELRAKRPQKQMDDVVFELIIDELASIRFKDTVSLQHYGEPLMDTNLEERIRLTSERLTEAVIQIKSNGDYLTPEVFERLISAGLDFAFVTNYDGRGKLSPAMRAMKKYLAEHPERRRQFEMRNGMDYYFNRGGLLDIPKKQMVELQRCVREPHVMNIDVMGNVVLCSNDYLCQTRFGNIREKSIMMIWDSPNYRQRRREIKRGEFNLDMCKKCVGFEE